MERNVCDIYNKAKEREMRISIFMIDLRIITLRDETKNEAIFYLREETVRQKNHQPTV